MRDIFDKESMVVYEELIVWLEEYLTNK